MIDFSKIIYDMFGFSYIQQIKLFNTLLIILFYFIIRWGILKIVWRYSEEARKRYFWRKFTTYFLTFVCFFFLGRVWFYGFKEIGTFLGLLSAGLAIALKDPVLNIAGWLFIVLRHPFSVGDRIQIGNSAGDVVDIRLFQFSVSEIGNWVDADQSTGRIIHIPNGRIFHESLANYSKAFDFIWDEMTVLLTFESNWKDAKRILLEVTNKHVLHLTDKAESKFKDATKKMMIRYSNLTPVVYTSVKDYGIALTVRYVCEPKKRRDTKEAIWEDILDVFQSRADLDFAYPTQRIVGNLKKDEIV